MKKRTILISLISLSFCSALLWLGKKERKQYYPM